MQANIFILWVNYIRIGLATGIYIVRLADRAVKVVVK